MKTNTLTHSKFTSLKLDIHALGIISETSDFIEVGILTLKNENREYKLTFGTEKVKVEGTFFSLDIEIEDLEFCKREFEDCKFDLLEYDLSQNQLQATIQLGCPKVDKGSVYLMFGELIYDNKPIWLKQEGAVYKDNINHLSIEFDANIENESTDLGGILITHTKSGRQLQLDSGKSFSYDKTIEVTPMCTHEMLKDDNYGIDNPMNLTLDDIDSGELKCEFYLGGESDVPFKSAKLFMVNNGKETIITATEE
jgi:hypothetical protein